MFKYEWKIPHRVLYKKKVLQILENTNISLSFTFVKDKEEKLIII